MDKQYCDSLVSMVTKTLSDEGKTKSFFVTKNGTFECRWSDHDNWNGGIDYYDFVFSLKYNDYLSIEPDKDVVCEEIYTTVLRFHCGDQGFIAGVKIEPIVERIIDWNAVLPEGKESVIKLIEDERDQLLANATGKQSYKEDGAEQRYRERHLHIIELAQKAGFNYPIPFNSLVDWWVEIRNTPGYAARTSQTNQMFESILQPIRESAEEIQAYSVDFSSISRRTQAINQSINDAQVLMREGSFSSAVDRIHTAFHAYLRDLLDLHGVTHSEGDTLQQLYSKLHKCYESEIKPQEVADLIKTAVRSGSGIVSSINDIRNRHTVSHPNSNLIQQREAILVISMVKCIVDYLEEVEKQLSHA